MSKKHTPHLSIFEDVDNDPVATVHLNETAYGKIQNEVLELKQQLQTAVSALEDIGTQVMSMHTNTGSMASYMKVLAHQALKEIKGEK